MPNLDFLSSLVLLTHHTHYSITLPLLFNFSSQFIIKLPISLLSLSIVFVFTFPFFSYLTYHTLCYLRFPYPLFPLMPYVILCTVQDYFLTLHPPLIGSPFQCSS